MSDLPEIPTLEWALRSHPQDLQLLREIEAVFEYRTRGLQADLIAAVSLKENYQEMCNLLRAQLDAK